MILPNTVRLKVPYRSQTNNALNPRGACNVSSLAMCLLFAGVEPRNPEQWPQFEDELYDYAEANGYRRHYGEDLAKIAADYGVVDRFTKHANGIEEIKGHLAGGNPCILHGYFTAFGHIIVAVGYDEEGLLIHDPYGEWTADGYILNTTENITRGKYQHYSYGLIRNCCITPGQLWVHFMGGKIR
jgi:uncharacterized protein YvpB